MTSLHFERFDGARLKPRTALSNTLSAESVFLLPVFSIGHRPDHRAGPDAQVATKSPPSPQADSYCTSIHVFGIVDYSRLWVKIECPVR